MMASQSLIATIVVVGLGLAFVFGAVAHWLRIPLLIGYLIAGVIIGPFTPGYVADLTAARPAGLGVLPN
jgi:CPA2 family monovalent cation:H+ antiporter-2